MNQTEKPERIWERWEGEPADAYAAFKHYLEQGRGKRQVRAVNIDLGLKPHSNYYYSEKYQWVERATAYDEWQDELQLAEVAPVVRNPRKQITEDLIHDYNSMLVTWRTIFQRMSDSGEVSAKDLKSMIDMRDTIDQMARRAAAMPSNYTAQLPSQVEGETGNNSNHQIIPQQVSWGDPVPSTIQLNKQRVRKLTDGAAQREQYDDRSETGDEVSAD